MVKDLFKISILTIFLVACSNDQNSDNTQNQTSEENGFLGEIDFIKSFGGSGNDTAQEVIQLIDGGYAILGFTESVDGDITDKAIAVNDYWLLRFDTDGNLLWNRTYGGSKDDRGQSLIQTSDGGFALVGYAMSDDGDGSNNEGFHDNWIVKLDASGNVQWEKSFGFSGHDHSYDLVQTDDGGYFFTGFLDVTQSNGEGNFGKGGYLTRHGVGEFWGTKLDANGNLQWRRFFGGSNNDRAFSVVQADDGGLLMAGASESDDFDISNSKGSYDYWVVKVDKNGNLLWENSFGGTGIDTGRDIVKTTDGGYVLTGSTFSTDTDVKRNYGEADVWVVKIDDDGQLLWETTLGGSGFDAAESISPTVDNGFVIAGNSRSADVDVTENRGENDIWVVKINASGDLVWQKSVGGSGLDFGFDAIENQAGELIVVGETASPDIAQIGYKGNSDLIFFKVK